jgi:hypothetical protein
MCLYVGFVPGLGIQVLYDATLYHWTSRCWRFGGSWRLHPQGSNSLILNSGPLSAKDLTSPARSPEFSTTPL